MLSKYLWLSIILTSFIIPIFLKYRIHCIQLIVINIINIHNVILLLLIWFPELIWFRGIRIRLLIANINTSIIFVFVSVVIPALFQEFSCLVLAEAEEAGVVVGETKWDVKLTNILLKELILLLLILYLILQIIYTPHNDLT